MLRRFAFLLVALLLALRGLAGGAMAMEQPLPVAAMAVAVAVAGHTAAIHEDQRAPEATPACADERAGPGCASDQHAAGHCAACGMCHPAPCALPAALPTAQADTARRDTGPGARFASAPAARAIRPPIA
ncbi:hypothetical protein [Melaminivora sp.]|uniref:hypothetical protein n=1 Tax=Melaminivora sp. TaxID=1933032 RepID=UPI0028A95E64|nr:hypothetical protein [Melaminivora sp.]